MKRLNCKASSRTIVIITSLIWELLELTKHDCHTIALHTVMGIPYPGTPGAPFFDGQNITDFLDRDSQLCADYNLSSESGMVYRLPGYCGKCFTGSYNQDPDQGSGLVYS